MKGSRSPLSLHKVVPAVAALAALGVAACGGGGSSNDSIFSTGVGGDTQTVTTTSGTKSSSGVTSTGVGVGGGFTTTSTGAQMTGAGGGIQGTPCKANGDCADKTKPLCDTKAGVCVGCLPASDMCPAGEYCDPANEECTGGCKSNADCNMGMVCDPMTHMCGDGCKPGTAQACYDGPAGTKGVGLCKGGTQTCDMSGSWGPCAGEVVPAPEQCNVAVDADCNGMVDDIKDEDGDGWTICDGDCCDTPGPCAATPNLVNPGAYEVVGDGIDNDCDPGTSDVVAPAACSTMASFGTVTATDIAHAIDLCQFTMQVEPLPMKKWGVITATTLNADGSVPTAAQLKAQQGNQSAIRTKFGTGGIVPKNGPTMAGMSSGAQRDEGDPGFVPLITGTAENGKSIAFSPAPGAPLGTYTAAHANGLLPGKCGAMVCPTGPDANDSVNTHLVIRVPTNAKSFSYDFRFFSAEYQSFQCTTFNDYYLAMLQTGAAGIPADHNISFDAVNNPVSVNNGFFQDCGGNGKACNACPDGLAPLKGTGLENGGQGVNGGGTEWLTTDAPVVAGENMTIEFVIFDVGDEIYDSIVLLDNFRWNLNPATVGTHM